MSAVRPYYLLGQRQLNLLEEQVRAALTSLVRRWWPSDEAVLFVGISNFYSGDNLQNESARYSAQRDDRWLALFGTERAWLALAEHWLGCQVAAESELVKTLTRAFSADLFGALANDSIAPELRSNLPWMQLPGDIMQPGAGTLLLEITISGVEIKLLASASLWPSLAERPVLRSQKKLTPCTVALGDSCVRISAALPIAQIPLTDIVTLAVGDFLNLGHDLSGRVQLQGEDIQLSLSATVGCNQDRKAIRLTAIHDEKTA